MRYKKQTKFFNRNNDNQSGEIFWIINKIKVRILDLRILYIRIGVSLIIKNVTMILRHSNKLYDPIKV